jgi:predicted PurR-regulated permease PerM
MRPDKTPPGETQLRIIWFALTTLAVAVIVAIGVGVIWGIGKFLNLLSPVVWPLAIAMVLAYLLDPAVSWLERRGLSRTSGIIVVFAVMVAVLGGVLANVIPQMTSEANDLVSRIPGYTEKAQQQVSAWAEHAARVASNLTTPPPGTNAPPPVNSGPEQSDTADTNASSTNAVAGGSQGNVHQIHSEIIASATDWTAKLLSSLGKWLLAQLAKASALIDVVIALILIPIYTFYFLREKRWIRAHWTDYLPIQNARLKHEVIFILDSINNYMIAFFRGQVLVSICSGILYTIGFLSLGLDYAFLLGFICMLFTMVPFLGSLISFIIAISLTVMQFGDWFHPLMVFVIFTIVISLENFFYSPHIMGHRVGLHPLIIIVAVMIGITLLGGLLGGVLAIPLAAALRVILYRYLWKRPEPTP